MTSLVRRLAALVPVALVAALLIAQAPEQPGSVPVGRTTLGGADPSVIKVNGLYVSAKSVDGGVAVRTASTLEGIATAPKKQVWKDTGLGEVWAPEIVHHDGRYRIYFAAGTGAAHRMYHISSASPDTGYSAATTSPG